MPNPRRGEREGRIEICFPVSVTMPSQDRGRELPQRRSCSRRCRCPGSSTICSGLSRERRASGPRLSPPSPPGKIWRVSVFGCPQTDRSSVCSFFFFFVLFVLDRESSRLKSSPGRRQERTGWLAISNIRECDGFVLRVLRDYPGVKSRRNTPVTLRAQRRVRPSHRTRHRP